MSKIRDKQKAIERWVFDEFKSQYPIELNEVHRNEEDPKPDFLLQGVDKIIGIELTEYHHLEELRKEHEIQEKIIQLAVIEFEKQSHKHIFVCFHYDFRFNEYFKNNSLKKNELAKRIASYIINEINTDENYHTQTEEYFRLKAFGLDNIFFHISIYSYPQITKNDWSQVTSFFSWRLSSNEAIDSFCRVVESKNSKFNSYLNNCDKCWLLIYFDGKGYSALDIESEFIENSNQFQLNSPFERIILFDAMWSKKIFNFKRP